MGMDPVVASSEVDVLRRARERVAEELVENFPGDARAEAVVAGVLERARLQSQKYALVARMAAAQGGGGPEDVRGSLEVAMEWEAAEKRVGELEDELEELTRGLVEGYVESTAGYAGPEEQRVVGQEMKEALAELVGNLGVAAADEVRALADEERERGLAKGLGVEEGQRGAEEEATPAQGASPTMHGQVTEEDGSAVGRLPPTAQLKDQVTKEAPAVAAEAFARAPSLSPAVPAHRLSFGVAATPADLGSVRAQAGNEASIAVSPLAAELATLRERAIEGVAMIKDGDSETDDELVEEQLAGPPREKPASVPRLGLSTEVGVLNHEADVQKREAGVQNREVAVQNREVAVQTARGMARTQKAMREAAESCREANAMLAKFQKVVDEGRREMAGQADIMRQVKEALVRATRAEMQAAAGLEVAGDREASLKRQAEELEGRAEELRQWEATLAEAMAEAAAAAEAAQGRMVESAHKHADDEAREASRKRGEREMEAAERSAAEVVGLVEEARGELAQLEEAKGLLEAEAAGLRDARRQEEERLDEVRNAVTQSQRALDALADGIKVGEARLERVQAMGTKEVAPHASTSTAEVRAAIAEATAMFERDERAARERVDAMDLRLGEARVELQKVLDDVRERERAAEVARREREEEEAEVGDLRDTKARLRDFLQREAGGVSEGIEAAKAAVAEVEADWARSKDMLEGDLVEYQNALGDGVQEVHRLKAEGEQAFQALDARVVMKKAELQRLEELLRLRQAEADNFDASADEDEDEEIKGILGDGDVPTMAAPRASRDGRVSGVLRALHNEVLEEETGHDRLVASRKSGTEDDVRARRDALENEEDEVVKLVARRDSLEAECLRFEARLGALQADEMEALSRGAQPPLEFRNSGMADDGQLVARRNALEAECLRFEARLEAAQKGDTLDKQAVDMLESEVRALRATKAGALEEADSLREEVSRLEGRATKEALGREAAEGALKALEAEMRSELDERSDKREQLRSKLSRVEVERDRALEEVDKLREAAERGAAAERRLSLMKEELGPLREATVAMVAEKDALTTALEGTRADLDAAKGDLERLEAQLEGGAEEVVRLELELGKSRKGAEKAEAKARERVEEVRALTDELCMSREKIKRLDVDMGKAQEKVHALESDLARSRRVEGVLRERAEAAEAIAENRANSLQLRGVRETLESERRQLFVEQDVRAARIKYDAAEDQQREARERLSQVAREVEEMEARGAKAVGDLERLARERGKAEKALSRKLKDLSSAEEHLREVRREVADAVEKREGLRDALVSLQRQSKAERDAHRAQVAELRLDAERKREEVANAQARLDVAQARAEEEMRRDRGLVRSVATLEADAVLSQMRKGADARATGIREAMRSIVLGSVASVAGDGSSVADTEEDLEDLEGVKATMERRRGELAELEAEVEGMRRQRGSLVDQLPSAQAELEALQHAVALERAKLAEARRQSASPKTASRTTPLPGVETAPLSQIRQDLARDRSELEEIEEELVHIKARREGGARTPAHSTPPLTRRLAAEEREAVQAYEEERRVLRDALKSEVASLEREREALEGDVEGLRSVSAAARGNLQEARFALMMASIESSSVTGSGLAMPTDDQGCGKCKQLKQSFNGWVQRIEGYLATKIEPEGRPSPLAMKLGRKL